MIVISSVWNIKSKILEMLQLLMSCSLDVIESELDYVANESVSTGSLVVVNRDVTWTLGQLNAGGTVTAVIQTVGNRSALAGATPASSASNIGYSLDDSSSTTNASSRRRQYNSSSDSAGYSFASSNFPHCSEAR